MRELSQVRENPPLTCEDLRILSDKIRQGRRYFFYQAPPTAATKAAIFSRSFCPGALSTPLATSTA